MRSVVVARVVSWGQLVGVGERMVYLVRDGADDAAFVLFAVTGVVYAAFVWWRIFGIYMNC